LRGEDCGEADEVGLVLFGLLQGVDDAGFLGEGDDGEAAGEGSVECGGAVDVVGGWGFAVDGSDLAGLDEGCGVVGGGGAFEAEDGVGGGGFGGADAGGDLGEDVLVGEEAGDDGFVVGEVGVEVLEDLVEGGGLLGVEDGRQGEECGEQGRGRGGFGGHGGLCRGIDVLGRDWWAGWLGLF
jgi:hypothetical protein